MNAHQYIRGIVLCLLLYLSIPVFSCECPPTPKLDKAYADSYALIFKGAVKSLGTCREVNKVRFIVHELFKGDSPKEIDVYFDCSSDCSMSFSVGETWIIYADYAQVGKPDVKFCSRSRKQVDNEVQIQSSFIPSDLSFLQELEWLQTNIGTKQLLAENHNADFSHRNELPTPGRSILLIALSFAGMLVVYFVVKRFMK